MNPVIEYQILFGRPYYLSMPIEVLYAIPSSSPHRSYGALVLNAASCCLLAHICPLERNYAFVFHFYSIMRWYLQHVQVSSGGRLR